MKTITITEAKKNLGKLLAAAAKGEDIGIVCGADIIALRKVEVEAVDYAWREYGVTPEEIAAFAKEAEVKYQALSKSGQSVTLTVEQLRSLLALTGHPVDEATLLAEPALAKEWLTPEEDAAWAHLQPGK